MSDIEDKKEHQAVHEEYLGEGRKGEVEVQKVFSEFVFLASLFSLDPQLEV